MPSSVSQTTLGKYGYQYLDRNFQRINFPWGHCPGLAQLLLQRGPALFKKLDGHGCPNQRECHCQLRLLDSSMTQILANCNNIITEYRMAWVGNNPQDSLVPTPLLWARTLSTRAGCLKLHPAWHPQILWATCSGVSPPSQ